MIEIVKKQLWGEKRTIFFRTQNMYDKMWYFIESICTSIVPTYKGVNSKIFKLKLEKDNRLIGEYIWYP